MVRPNFRLDPHVFLGRVANGESLSLVAANPAGILWKEVWSKKEDGYYYSLIGPIGSAEGPMTYEKAYGRVRETMELLRKMDEDERALAAKWSKVGEAS